MNLLAGASRWCVLAIAIRTAAMAAEPADLPTIDGPETEGLVKGITGLLAYPEPVGGILATVLPSLETKTVRPPGKHPAVSDMSGSDRKGRLAVVESRRGTLVLRLVNADGSDGKELLERPDAGFQSVAIGRPALSPEGSHVAFVGGTRTLFMSAEPKLTFREGTLEMWAAGEARRVDLNGEIKALDRSLSWLPERNTLLYSALVSPETDTFPRELIREYSRAAGGLIPAVERKFPVIHELELRECKSVPLCLGRRSVASQDGKRILIQGIGFDWMLYDIATRRLEAAKVPGLHDRDRLGIYEGGVIALLEGELAIYWALPTTGASQRTTENNSPLVGKKKMPCIKAARLSSGEFQTIIPHMDPRHEVVFGPTMAAR